MFLKTVKGPNKTYLYLVEGYRDPKQPNRVKHKTIANLGSTDNLDRSFIQKLALDLLEYSDSNLFEPNSLKEVATKNWGGPKIVEQLWALYDLDIFFKEQLQSRRLKYNLQEAIKLMLVDRICAPRSKYQTHLEQEHYHGLSPIKLNHLYKALDELSTYKSQLEEHLYNKNVSQFNMELELVFFDVTTIYFESINADDLKDFGYSKDAKFNEVQIVLSLMIDKDGRPVSYELFSGNTYEGNTLLSSIKTLKSKYNITKAIVVADRGINSKANIELLKAAGFEYVVGCRFKSLPAKYKAQLLEQENYKTIVSNDEESLKYKEFNYNRNNKPNGTDSSSRIICTWSSKRAAKDRKDRARLVEKAEKLLKSNGIKSSRGASKYIKSEISGSHLDHEKISSDAKWDGYYAIETNNANLTPLEISSAYHMLWKIEESFRILKSHLEVRPVFHWTKKRIEGHFVLSFIAFLFERTLEIGLSKEGEKISANAIRKSINSMTYTEFSTKQRKFEHKSEITDISKKILDFLATVAA